MLPTVPVNDPVDLRLAHAILSRQHPLRNHPRFVAKTDRAHLRKRKLVAALLAMVSRPTLRTAIPKHLVSRVRLISPDIQVLRINTRRVITDVTYQVLGRYRTVGEHPRCTVGTPHRSTIRHSEKPVTKRVTRGSPNPAGVITARDIDFGPEPRLRRSAGFPRVVLQFRRIAVAFPTLPMHPAPTTCNSGPRASVDCAFHPLIMPEIRCH